MLEISQNHVRAPKETADSTTSRVSWVSALGDACCCLEPHLEGGPSILLVAVPADARAPNSVPLTSLAGLADPNIVGARAAIRAARAAAAAVTAALARLSDVLLDLLLGEVVVETPRGVALGVRTAGVDVVLGVRGAGVVVVGVLGVVVAVVALGVLGVVVALGVLGVVVALGVLGVVLGVVVLGVVVLGVLSAGVLGFVSAAAERLEALLAVEAVGCGVCTLGALRSRVLSRCCWGLFSICLSPNKPQEHNEQ